MSYPKELKYTREHEWAKAEDGKVRMGITDFAQRELGDIVYVELPEVGREVSQGEAMITVESVKAASDVYAPVSGRVVEVNGELDAHPEYVNQDPYGKGWMALLEMRDPSELEALLSAEEYEKLVGDEDEQGEG
jgi:glycine cleavage system H protein